MKMRNKLSTSPQQKVTLSTKILIGIAGGTTFLAGVLLLLATGTTTNTLGPGNWNQAANWSEGIPGDDGTANINHSLTLDKNINITGGFYTINAPVIDPTGGTLYSLSLGTDAAMEVKANMTFEGTASVSNNAELIIFSGDTLRLGATVFENGSSVIIDEGGVLIINGNLQNKNNSDGIVVNGRLIVNGNFEGGNGSEIAGNGGFTTTGSMTGAGTVFGASPLNCSSNCDGRSLIGFTNSISSNQSICISTPPAALTGTTTASSPSYKWQKSIDNVTYTTITGATAASYTPGNLTVSTWYRRIIISGGSSSTSSAIKITVNTGGIWTGVASNKWNLPGNWCGAVPLATDNVIIPSGCPNMPSVPTGNFTCNNLTILAGASLTMESGSTLSIKGNMTNTGTFTDNGGTLIFNGTVLQTISGITSIGSLTMNNPTSLILNNPITVNGIIKLLNGMIISNGNLTVNLDAGGIAYQSTDLGRIFGNINLKKNVLSNRFHYLSSPLSGQTTQDWNDDVSIETGRIYYSYDETNTNPDPEYGWTGINNLSTSLVAMRGYALYFKSTRTMDNTGSYIHGATPYSINLTHTYSGGPDADGWNLVGNPYPSTIDWDATSGWTKTNIYGAIYCWDAVNDRYTTYSGGVGVNGGTRYIASMQSFWVRVDTTKNSGTLAATSLVRSTLSAKFYKTSAANNPLLKLSVANNGYEDETMVRILEDATSGFDGEFDAHKMMNSGENPSLYTLSNGISYAINSMNETKDKMEIPLAIRVAKTGLCKISAREIKNFNIAYSIVLEDKVLNTSQDLRQISDYEFNLTSTQSFDRFILRIKREVTTTSVNNSAEEMSAKIKVANKVLYVNNPTSTSSEASMYIFSTNGSEIGKAENINFNSGEYMYDMSSYQPGVYIVKIVMNKKVFTQKVVLN